MERWTETKVTREREETLYACSKCEFTATTKDAIVGHYSAMHACAEHTFVGGKNLGWFEDKVDAELWGGHYSGDGSCSVCWKGPGWYVTERRNDPSWEVSKVVIYYLQDVIDGLTEEVEGLVKVVSELEGFLAKNKKG